MEQEFINYILWYCQEWMKPEEKVALQRINLTDEYGEQQLTKIDLTNKLWRKFYGFDDEDVNELVAMGKEKMELFIAQRIFKNHKKEIINNCPKCGKLARTPKAKQCRHCFFDWH